MLASVVAWMNGCRGRDVTLVEQEHSPMQVHAITGTVAYRSRIGLPPEAQVRVLLEDTSLADTSSRLVSETLMPTEGRQSPIPFKIPYDAERIQQSHRYCLRATIAVGDMTLFASTQEYPVLTQSAKDVSGPVHIEVEPVSPSAGRPRLPTSTEPPAVALEDTRWLLVELDGQPIIDVPGQRALAITFQKADSLFNGSSGVNNFGGEWSLADGRLSIKPGAMTMMSGPEPLMQQERAFIRALKGVRGYHLTGTTLRLLDGETVIATFKARVEQGG
jgi:putative lipoprotein